MIRRAGEVPFSASMDGVPRMLLMNSDGGSIQPRYARLGERRNVCHSRLL